MSLVQISKVIDQMALIFTAGTGSSKKKLGIEIGKNAAEKSGGLFSAEDWACTKCGNVNWARRSTCNVCNAPKFADVEERTGALRCNRWPRLVAKYQHQG